MKDKKLTGSFYTPKVIADFVVNHIAKKIKTESEVSILEPSAGDGSFVKSVFENSALKSRAFRITAIEKNKKELDKITKLLGHKNKIKYVHQDFLDYQKGNPSTFSIVIGNPPYIKKNLLSKKQINLCKEIHLDADLADHEPKNIWAAFLVRCIKFTDPSKGILAFVLPAELLQVKFAKELRDLIAKEFERVEIFSFNELLFEDCKGQDTLLLIGEKKSNYPGIFYCTINKANDLKENKFQLTPNVSIKDSKWTHHHLDSDEMELIGMIKNELNCINDYCSSKAGIVTAANNFFIINESTVKEYSLHRFVKPIVQKGSFVNGSVILTEKEFDILIDNCKPAFLLSINENSKISENEKFQKYLKLGVKDEINKRYKMLVRKKWYQVPNIGAPAEAFFFKRCNEYPKLIRNSADVLVTDCAYEVKMRDQYQINDLIYSFYNSLTLSFAELNGRYYGGGVLELTPNEFKGLPIPYVKISNVDFNAFAYKFKRKESIKEICKTNDLFILKSTFPKIDIDTVNKLYNIREKLFLSRTKAL